MQRAVKRAFDVTFSLSAIIILSPLWIIVAAAVLVSSPGGIFFSQKRTGYHGRTFKMLKFRSMVINSEADEQQADDDNDPRTTACLLYTSDAADE